MHSSTERIISILPSSEQTKRTVLVMPAGSSSSVIHMRQESFSEAVGWFVQSVIELSPEQVSGLRQALGCIPQSNRLGRQPWHRVDRPETVSIASAQRAFSA